VPTVQTVCEKHTKISSAVSDGRFSRGGSSDDDRMLEKLALLVMAGSRKGLRESGRGGGSSKGETGGGGEAVTAGDAARLRKGLLELRFKSKPDGCRSM